MKITINTGAYGWCHERWKKSFYPEDLPSDSEDDWRLSYYSNEFNTVMVPASYWVDGAITGCGQWLDDVHPDFRFYVECDISMFEFISLSEFKEKLEVLQPQLAAVVFPEASRSIAPALRNQLSLLFDQLKLEILGANFMPGSRPVWREEKQKQSNFALYGNDLSDLRVARAMVDKFASELTDSAGNAAIIVDHRQLTAENLTRFRSLLEIMGF